MITMTNEEAQARKDFQAHLDRSVPRVPEMPPVINDLPEPWDPYCERSPEQIPEYVAVTASSTQTPSEFVIDEEGTYNPKNGHFACTECYIRLGEPVGKNGRRWVAP